MSWATWALIALTVLSGVVLFGLLISSIWYTWRSQRAPWTEGRFASMQGGWIDLGDCVYESGRHHRDGSRELVRTR